MSITNTNTPSIATLRGVGGVLDIPKLQKAVHTISEVYQHYLPFLQTIASHEALQLLLLYPCFYFRKCLIIIYILCGSHNVSLLNHRSISTAVQILHITAAMHQIFSSQLIPGVQHLMRDVHKMLAVEKSVQVRLLITINTMIKIYPY